MFYRASYCCECGEKIERFSDSLLGNSKFCEVCKPNFRLENFAPKGLAGIGLLGAVFGFGSLLQKPLEPKQLIEKGEIAKIASIPNQSANSIKADKPVVNLNASNVLPKVETKKATPSFEKQVSVSTEAKPEIEVSEPAYYCGAKTKKGSPCSRKVKGAVRCWQHVGQPAMLPTNQLVAN
jgi:hypothetical protein